MMLQQEGTTKRRFHCSWHKGLSYTGGTLTGSTVTLLLVFVAAAAICWSMIIQTNRKIAMLLRPTLAARDTDSGVELLLALWP